MALSRERETWFFHKLCRLTIDAIAMAIRIVSREDAQRRLIVTHPFTDHLVVGGLAILGLCLFAYLSVTEERTSFFRIMFLVIIPAIASFSVFRTCIEVSPGFVRERSLWKTRTIELPPDVIVEEHSKGLVCLVAGSSQGDVLFSFPFYLAHKGKLAEKLRDVFNRGGEPYLHKKSVRPRPAPS